jgi:ribulose-phosphate 3-epimerase
MTANPLETKGRLTVPDRAQRVNQARALQFPAVVPSILSCDFSRLKDEIEAVQAGGAPMIHLDVMDGHFVDNLSYGPPVIESIRKVSTLPFDTHLMIERPQKYLDAFVTAGCDILTIHVEAVADPRPTLEQIKSRGCLAGIALNPPTATGTLHEAIQLADLVLVMSVMPGFGAQAFDSRVLGKLDAVRAMARPGTWLALDGGLNRATLPRAAAAGAEILVVGSAIFRSQDYAAEMQELRRLAAQASLESRSTP